MKISLYNFVSFDAGHTNEHLSPEQMQKLDAQLAFNEWLFFDYSGGCELFAITEESGKHLPAAEIESRLAEVIPHFTTNFRAQEELQMQPAIIRLLKSVAGLQVDSSGRVLLEAVREAFEKTTEEGYSGPVLHYLFQKGIWLHEKIRMESSWYKFAVQPAAVVRELAGKIFGTVKNKYVHFIGWHEDFELIVDELAAAGVQDFTLHCAKPQLVNRKIRQSNTPPSKINGKLETADLIFIGDVDAEFQLQKNAIARRMAARNNARLLICNYSSDVKIIEHVKKLYNVFSYEKSELLHLIKHNNNSRQAILPEINQWFEHETQEFLRWMESDKRYNFAGMIGASKEMQRIFELISRVARTTITILIDGESGTGKELVARAVHNLSPRSEKRFVAVNCGAIPENLLESELFGHEKGAFTGAEHAKTGLIETAEGGTILLDEIAELQPHLQVKLLRFLQEGEIKRVGGTETRHPNVRVLAATNKNLFDLVEAGRFRSDLYYRLNVLQLTLPPLRERGKDVMLIANHFLQRINKAFQKEVQEFSPEALQALGNYPWPGNVRELENAVERACALAVGSKISVFDLPPALQSPKQDRSIPVATKVSLTLKDMERQHILSVLDQYDWNYEEASKALAIGRTTLWRKLREYGVEQKP